MKRSILDEEQTALRKRARHFVRRLRDAVGAEIFGAIGQRPAEMKVRCVRRVHDDRNAAFVRQLDDLREFSDDPEVVWRRQEHAVDAFTSKRFLETSNRRPEREAELWVVIRNQVSGMKAAMDHRGRDGAVRIAIHQHTAARWTRAEQRKDVENGRAVGRRKAPGRAVGGCKLPFQTLERFVVLVDEYAA